MADVAQATLPSQENIPSAAISEDELGRQSDLEDSSTAPHTDEPEAQGETVNGTGPVEVVNGVTPAEGTSATVPTASPTKSKLTGPSGSKPKAISTTAKPGIKPGPPTPLVKKILNSGTFGMNKNSPSKPSTSSATPSAENQTETKEPVAPASPVKAATPGGPPPPNRRSTLAVPPSSATSKSDNATASAAAPSRRTSMAPAAKAIGVLAAAASKASVAKAPAAATKSSAAASTSAPAKSVTPTPRKSITSPTPSTSSAKVPPTKPRTSVGGTSSATPATARPVAKPTTATPATAPKQPRSSTSKTTGSHLSEVKEEAKADAELEQKYRDAVADVAAKTEQIAALEVELASLRSSLDDKLTEMDKRTSEMEDLQKATSSGTEAREGLEAEVQRLQSLADSVQAEYEAKINASEAELQTLRDELEGANAKVAELEKARDELQASLASLQDELKVIQATHANDAAAAAVEHEALLKAKEDLDSIKAETDKLTAAHAQEVAEHERTVAGFKTQLTLAEGSLESTRAELASFKREREDTSQRLAELEVEVLELKEAAETADDSKVKELAALKSSQQSEKAELERVHATKLAEADVANKEAEKRWEEAIQAAKDQHVEELAKSIKEAEDAAEAAHLKTQEALAAEHAEAVWAKEVEWLEKVEVAQKEAEQAQKGLQDEVKRLATELEGQEAKYAAQVDVVKQEHSELLKQAFVNAKSEATAEHEKELAVLRGEFDATLKQVRDGHQTQIQAFEASNNAEKEDLSKSLNKNISTLTVELQATRDDLAKAKGSLAAATSEVQSLKEQLSVAQKAAEDAVSDAAGAQTEYIDSLNKQLANVHREMSDLQDVLKTSQISFTDELDQMKKNHAVDLEEASKSRVKALEELQAKNDERLAKFKGDLAELQAKVEDERNEKLQAEAQLAALKAQSPPATPNPKANGVTGASKEELHKLHQAHELKLSEVEAEHVKALKAVQEQINELRAQNDNLQAEVSRKEMEKSMFESENEDLNEENKKLLADLEDLQKQLGAK